MPKICKCGNPVKDKKSDYCDNCYPCDCTKEFIKKGDGHCPSHKAVVAKKHIFEKGWGFIQTLTQ
jgi:hypothetical protein